MKNNSIIQLSLTAVPQALSEELIPCRDRGRSGSGGRIWRRRREWLHSLAQWGIQCIRGSMEDDAEASVGEWTNRHLRLALLVKQRECGRQQSERQAQTYMWSRAVKGPEGVWIWCSGEQQAYAGQEFKGVRVTEARRKARRMILDASFWRHQRWVTGRPE